MKNRLLAAGLFFSAVCMEHHVVYFAVFARNPHFITSSCLPSTLTKTVFPPKTRGTSNRISLKSRSQSFNAAIVYLKEKEKSAISEIFKSVQGSQGAKYSALKLLNENKIIEQTAPQGRNRRITISLTEKGKKIAEHLTEIEKILEP
jgi:predicted transcriptional regulator